MRKYEARIRKLESRSKGGRIIMSPPECPESGTPEFQAFHEWVQQTAPGTIVIARNDARRF